MMLIFHKCTAAEKISNKNMRKNSMYTKKKTIILIGISEIQMKLTLGKLMLRIINFGLLEIIMIKDNIFLKEKDKLII